MDCRFHVVYHQLFLEEYLIQKEKGGLKEDEDFMDIDEDY